MNLALWVLERVVLFAVSLMSHVFYNTPTCNELAHQPDAFDLTLRDGDHTSCLLVRDTPPSSIILRLSRQVKDLRRTTFVLVTVHDIDCQPQGGLMVLATTFCRAEPCGPRSVCTTLRSKPGRPCRFRCCDTGQPCGTFYLILRGQAIKGTLCEVTI